MNQIVNDGTLERGNGIVTPSGDIPIGGVVYAFLDFKDDYGKARTEKDYTSRGKPKAASHAEDFRMLSGTIRGRTDQAIPPRWTVFSYDGSNFYIVDIEKSGSSAGLAQYSTTIMQCVTGTLVIT